MSLPPFRTRLPRLLAALACLVTLLPGCPGASAGGRFEGSFTRTDTLRKNPPRGFAMPARAAWCSAARRLEVTGLKDDLGIGLVVYAQDSLAAGAYPAFDPGLDSSVRPGAAAAVRWFDDQIISGMQSDSGELQLSGTGARLELTFGFRLRSLDGSDTIRMRGRATGLSAEPCPSDSLTSAGPRQ